MEIRSVDENAIQLLRKCMKEKRQLCKCEAACEFKKAWCEGLCDSIKTANHTSQFISTGNERRCLVLTVLTLTDQIMVTNTLVQRQCKKKEEP